MTAYSFSQLHTFDRCPLEYVRLYIDKQSEPLNPRMILGLVIHKTLERFHQQQCEQALPQQGTLFDIAQKTSLPTLHQLLTTSWHSYDHLLSPDEKRDMQARAINIITTYINQGFHKTVPHAVEQSWRYQIDEQTALRGRIDRIDKINDKYIVIDYKTGRQSSAKRDNWQLALYAAALHATGLLVSSGAYWFLQTGDIEQVDLSKEIQNQALDRAKQTIASIKAIDVPSLVTTHTCDVCGNVLPS